MYLLAGSSADVTIPLVGSPTSVSVKVYDHVGQVLAEDTVVPDAGATEITYTVPASLNDVLLLPSWERRTVRWAYTSDGRTIRGSRAYKIADGVNHDADEDLVRSLLGVDIDELADEQIDLTSAYFYFRSRVGPELMDAAMVGYDNRPLLIARAIAALAALDHVDGMATQVALKESSGSNSYERGAIDWASVRETLQAIISMGLTSLSDQSVFLPNLFDVGTRTDAITGA